MSVMENHFLGIGAARAATTWLYVNLAQHPEVWMPPLKEVHFFDRETSYASNSFLAAGTLQAKFTELLTSSAARRQARLFLNPIRWYQAATVRKLQAALWALGNGFRAFNEQRYFELFRFGNGLVTGDITPSYALLSSEDVGKIAGLLPKARVIYILRDPIERSWSNIRFICKRQGISVESLSNERLLRMAASEFIRPRGEYLHTLRTWKIHFPEERFLLLCYEDIQKNPRAVLRTAHTFLGLKNVDFCCPTAAQRKYNFAPAVCVPSEIEAALAEQFYPMLLELQGDLGEMVRPWLKRCRKALGYSDPMALSTGEVFRNSEPS